MFANDTLKAHLLESATIKSQAMVIAEWNMNDYSNISKVGNYRFRPLDGVASKYGSVPSFYDPLDEGYFYTDATYSDVVLDGGINEVESPMLLKQSKEKEQLLFSLEDCFGRFRPRSGINKVRYGVTKYLHNSNPDMALRPRYYMADKNDPFKYWTSYRTEGGVEYGIANVSSSGRNYINDAAPFVVYDRPVAANRLVVKMQTNVGSVDQAPYFTIIGQAGDPFYGYKNSTVPSDWKIEILVDGRWETAKSFSAIDKRVDGSPIVGPDGHVEIGYGLLVPEQYQDKFNYIGKVSSISALPASLRDGDAYLVVSSNSDIGTFHIWYNSGYQTFKPQYAWQLLDDKTAATSLLITELADLESYLVSGVSQYREFQYITGMRVVVSQMNKFGSVFDLIEMSPRIAANITDSTDSFNITKIASDLGTAGLPVGQLLASVGNLTLFDAPQAFSEINTSSIIPFSSFKNMKVKLYDAIDIDSTRYYVPIKTMYADSFPEINNKTRLVSIELRDLYSYFESLSAPQLLLTNVSVSYAIATILDYIGFANYDFKRVSGEKEEIIPFFFVDPSQTVAEVLQNIAVSTQSSMFFDEYNNFIVMSKGYMLPSNEDRSTDITLIGSDDFLADGPLENVNENRQLANIVDLTSQGDSVFNDGRILFTSRYIQKSQSSIKQAYMLDSQKTWVYRPVQLWEATGENNAKSQNEEISTQGSYSLTAIPLKSNLTSSVPEVVNGEIVNNIVDFGEAVYWLGRYNGYFYANGEVIRFDAIEYSVSGTGNVWITSVQDYQNYFSKIPFRGKMYPTGRVRIFAEPNYKILSSGLVTVLQDGAVAKHGRGQFGTTVTSHSAGIDQSWTNGSRLGGLGMNSKFLFDVISNEEPDVVENLPAEIALIRDSILEDKTSIKELYDSISRYQKRILSNSADQEAINSISVANAQINLFQQQVAENMKNLYDYLTDTIKYQDITDAYSQAQRSQITGKIKNFLAYSYDSEAKTSVSTDSQMVQASALVMDGANSADTSYLPVNHLTYVYKTTSSSTGDVITSKDRFTHFGTRMRILGKIGTSDTEQKPYGEMSYLTVESDNPDDRAIVSGGSGGIAGLLNPNSGEGYYFEIAALDANNASDYGAGNILFYKVITSGTSSTDFGYGKYSLPQLLWRGVGNIVVDSGDFVGQSRVFAQSVQTVNDLAFEYVDNVDGTRTFYLYLNGMQIATVTDTTPIVAGNATALFIRGTSKCMFENVYALSTNYAQNPSLKLTPAVNAAFGTESVSINESFSKYAISGLVQSTYLSSIGPSEGPKYNIYYDEFGTIMREAAYINARYDKAYPALYSRITPSSTKLKSYAVSSYYGGAYGAEFLVFNTTDTAIALDSTTAAPLQIQGIAFTQNNENELTVDEYFSKKSDLSNPKVENGVVATSPFTVKQKYQEIKNTRVSYGRNEFTITAPYIQSRDSANELMGWLADKVMKPRKSLGAEIFAMPIIQLGDIVQLDYTDDDVYQGALPNTRFVVYQIDYSRAVGETVMKIYLSEVS